MADEPGPPPESPAEPPPAEAAPPEAPPDAPPEAPPAAPPPNVPVVIKEDTHYLPILVLTCCFGALFIILPLLVRKGPNRGIIRCCTMLSLFCIWIFWVTIYISQMNPIMGPRMHNTTLAWIAYKIGNPIKSPAPIEEGEPETF